LELSAEPVVRPASPFLTGLIDVSSLSNLRQTNDCRSGVFVSVRALSRDHPLL
jgi:hypothetical protein